GLRRPAADLDLPDHPAVGLDRQVQEPPPEPSRSLKALPEPLWVHRARGEDRVGDGRPRPDGWVDLVRGERPEHHGTAFDPHHLDGHYGSNCPVVEPGPRPASLDRLVPGELVW